MGNRIKINKGETSKLNFPFSCIKIKYETEQLAQDLIDNIWRKQKKIMFKYACSKCRCWHLSSSPSFGELKRKSDMLAVQLRHEQNRLPIGGIFRGVKIIEYYHRQNGSFRYVCLLPCQHEAKITRTVLLTSGPNLYKCPICYHNGLKYFPPKLHPILVKLIGFFRIYLTNFRLPD